MNSNKTKNSKQQSNSDSKPVSTKQQSGALGLIEDLRDWIKSKDEFPCINAVPLDEDIFEWHCNICPDSGDFKGAIFHVIIYFDEEYPVLVPKVKLCTPIPHPLVVDEWICLDMIKRDNSDDGYTVRSILMKLESFFFCESNDGGNINVDGSFEKFVCDKCKHCYKKPFPVTLSISKQLGMVEKKKKELKSKCKDNHGKNGFCLWDGLYHDVEMLILNFLQSNEVIKMKRISRKLRWLVYDSKIIQKNGIKCWFHGSLTIVSRDENNCTTKMLCLGVGVNRICFDRKIERATFAAQLFGSQSIADKIGDLRMIKCINTTFDLLSSDAFVKHDIRNTKFNDCRFKHFIPLYINKKHGKKAMKQMDKFVLKLWNKRIESKRGKCKCHPSLKLYTIANMMNSLIVSVMKASDDNYGIISMNYSVNVIKTYFRLHHTLIAIYLRYKKEISSLLEYQIEMFFGKHKKNVDGYCQRHKKHTPDLGVFLSYLTLWEKNKRIINNKKFGWIDIVYELLDEIFTRQTKCVLDGNNDLINAEYCSLNERVLFHWKTNISSNRLFLLNCFFFKQCWKKNRSLSLEEQFDLYNNNFGSPIVDNDSNLAFKFKKFVENIHYNVYNFQDFFDTIGVEYIGRNHLGLWFIECMKKSEYRGYHIRDFYVSKNPQSSCKIRKEERNDWILQPQIERAEFKTQREKEVRKQKRLGKRRLQQFEEAKMRLVTKNNRKNGLPVEGIFSFSKVTGDRVVSHNLYPDWIEKGSCDYLRVYLKINKLSDDVASLDEMIIDAYERTPRLNFMKILFGKLFDRFANNEDGTMSRNDLRNYIIYYHVGRTYDLNVDDKVKKIFKKCSNDSKKEKLTKAEWFTFWTSPDFRFYETRQIVHYPNTFDADGVTMPIKIIKVNNEIYYRDFGLSEIFLQIGGTSSLKIRVRGKYIDGSCFECVVNHRGDIEHPSTNKLRVVPFARQTKRPRKGKRARGATGARRTKEAKSAKQQTDDQGQKQHQRRRTRKVDEVDEPRRGKGGPRYNSCLITLKSKTENTRKNLNGALEKALKDWLKTEENRIKRNASNGNLSPYGNGIRKGITSRIYNDKICTNDGSNIKFFISTIKNGQISENVNEISLDCQIVRVCVILTKRESYDISVNEIYFDGKLTPTKHQVHDQDSLGKKCYNWTKTSNTNKMNKNKNNKKKGDSNDRMVSCQSGVVHGAVYGKKYGKDNVVYYGDFSLKSLCNCFGNGLKNGIMPRAKGYTLDANKFKFYVCGGYDYLIYGKSKCDNGKHMVMAHQVSNSQAKPAVPTIAPAPPASTTPIPPIAPQQACVETQSQDVQVETEENIINHVFDYQQQQLQHEYEYQQDERMTQMAVNPRVYQLNISQLVPVYSNFGNQGNGRNVIVGYLVPSAMTQMQPMQPIQQMGQVQQVQQFSEMRQRAPTAQVMPQAMRHGMHNGAIPRRPPMKNTSNKNNIN